LPCLALSVRFTFAFDFHFTSASSHLLALSRFKSIWRHLKASMLQPFKQKKLSNSSFFFFFSSLSPLAETPKPKTEILSNHVPTLSFSHPSGSSSSASSSASPALSSHHSNLHPHPGRTMDSRTSDTSQLNSASGRPLDDSNQQPLLLLCGLLVATLLVVFSLLILLLWKQRKRSHKPSSMCGKGGAAFLQLDTLNPDDRQQQQMLLLMQPNSLNVNGGSTLGQGTPMHTAGQQILINHNSRGYLQQPAGSIITPPDLLRNNAADKMQLLARLNQGGNLIDHLLIRTLDSNGSNGSSCGGLSALCPSFVNTALAPNGSSAAAAIGTLTSNGWTGRGSAMHQISSRSSGSGSLGSSRGGGGGGTISDDDQRSPAAHWVGAHSSSRRHRRRAMRPIRLSTEAEEDEPDYAEPIISTPAHSDCSVVYDQCDEYGAIGCAGNVDTRSDDTPPIDRLTRSGCSNQQLISFGKHSLSSAAAGQESLDSNDTSPSYASYDSVSGRPPLPRSLPPAPRMQTSTSGQMHYHHLTSSEGYRAPSGSFESNPRKTSQLSIADHNSLLTISN
jgi:hypothetical protein